MADRPLQSDTASPEGSIHIVGTAHVSAKSVEEVEQAIEHVQPDIVAVELDDTRYRQLKGDLPDDLEPEDLLQGNTVYQFLAYWMLSYVQQRLGERFDIEPGADMRAAVESAEKIGAGVALVDRDIQTTIQRFWTRMTLRERFRMIFGLFMGMFGFATGMDGDAAEFDIDEMTDTDVVTAMMEEFRRFSPGGAEALIDERDAYIAHHLVGLRDQGYTVVAVVGAGHRSGIEQFLDEPASIPPITDITGLSSGRRFSLYKAGGYLIALAFLGFFFLLAMAGVRDGFLLRLFFAWFLFNGIFAFALAKLAGAHWTSAGVGGSVAWLTSINPMLAPGWFAGYVELRYTNVNVTDIGQLNELLGNEALSFRQLISDMLDVPLFKLIAVVAMTNIGSMIATFLFPFLILPWLAADIGGVGAVGDRLLLGARRSAEIIWNLFI